jgi:hypothetical protein
LKAKFESSSSYYCFKSFIVSTADSRQLQHGCQPVSTGTAIPFFFGHAPADALDVTAQVETKSKV